MRTNDTRQDVTEQEVTEQLASIRAELAQMRIMVGQLIAIETGEPVRVLLPLDR